MIAGVNCLAEMTSLPLAGLPVLAVIHDDFAPTNNFAGLLPYTNTYRAHNRLMSPRSEYFRQLEQGAHMVNGNENDSDWFTWELEYLQYVRATRPDLRLHHPAPNTNGEYPYDPAIAAACDIIDQHVGIGADSNGTVVFFPAPTPVMFGKPVWITEVEVDPNYPELISAIPDAIAYYQRAGYQAVFAWGVAPTEPDVLFHKDIMTRILALNTPNQTTAPITAPTNGGSSMPQTVPGGALDTYVKSNSLTLLTSETEMPDGTSAYVLTNKGMLIATKEDGWQVHALPFQ